MEVDLEAQSQASLPAQTGETGKYLKTNGTDADWALGTGATYTLSGTTLTITTP
jgi:hypothetical protein